MKQETGGFDPDRFASLLAEGNHLGAWVLIKQSGLDRTEEGILIGQLANGLISMIADARGHDNKEKQAYLRSLLSYMLKDWPGLASLYREQVRQALPSFVPENLQDLWQEFSDVMSGRKTLDESMRQRMEEAGQKAREFGVDMDPLKDFARDAEREFRRGAEEVRDFLKNVFQGGMGAKNRDTDARGFEENQNDSSATDQTSADEPSIKVKIQDADDPLPKDIHQAQPADKEK